MKQVFLIVHPLQLVLYAYGYVVRRLDKTKQLYNQVLTNRGVLIWKFWLLLISDIFISNYANI